MVLDFIFYSIYKGYLQHKERRLLVRSVNFTIMFANCFWTPVFMVLVELFRTPKGLPCDFFLAIPYLVLDICLFFRYEKKHDKILSKFKSRKVPKVSIYLWILFWFILLVVIIIICMIIRNYIIKPLGLEGALAF